MQNRTILNVAVFSNAYPVVVSPEYRIEPDAGAGLKSNCPDYGRVWGHKMPLSLENCLPVVQRIYHRALA